MPQGSTRGLVCSVLAALALAEAPAAGAVTSRLVTGGLASPVDIVYAGDTSGRLFVAEQGGKLRIVRSGVLVAAPFLDISARVVAGGERGLLGVAFHPRFAVNGRLFVDYTRQSDSATVIAEFHVGTADPDAADAASERVLLTIEQPFANHNGGALRFGPDGYLYIGMGDGGSANDPGNRAQDTHVLLGKILRIDVDLDTPYAIPAGNPFAGGGGGRAEIWAFGVRNPWRINFDRATGDLYIGDVGQDAFEEIDWLPAGTGAGTNFGWRVMEADHCTNLGGGPPCFDRSLTPPVFAYSHSEGCSITGGLVYRGIAVPSLAGRYVFGDFCSGRIRSAARDETGSFVARDVAATDAVITTFGEDANGELYYADYLRGQIFRLEAEASDRVDVVEYYHAGLDHYFITGLATEIAALDGRVLAGWARTGYALPARGVAQSGTRELCRFYIPPAQGDSHFLSASPDECDDVARKFPSFIAEGPTRIFMMLPDAATGACPAGAMPVYRIWNARADANHRYTTSRAIRDRMVGVGGVAEGYGSDAVALCAPS